MTYSRDDLRCLFLGVGGRLGRRRRSRGGFALLRELGL